MPVRIGSPELLILLAIVVLLFGGGRIGRIATEMVSGIKAFREGISGEEKAE
jgi:sec-independent protein translocase protein TatA